ncbi:MAG TPA: LPS export ABC transporter permease LptF [Caulobacteraceae bacterium]|jgi:lipopolysaccharide export system permease protein
MPRIQDYLFRQLLGPAVFATAALAAVALLSQSLSALDVIVDQRQGVGTFLYLTVLALPQLLGLILPVSLFVAAVLALNRLHTEHEIVVCFAAGMSRWNVASPALRLAALAALLTLFLNLWVQPPAARALRDEIFRARADLAAALIRPGVFTEAAPGLTVYAQEATPEGRLKNLFVHQVRGNGATTFIARDGQVSKENGSPTLVMRQGSSQQVSGAGVLNFLSFDEYSLDLAPFLSGPNNVQYKASDRWLHELFFPDLRRPWERDNRLKMLAEGHARLAGPLYSLALMAMALAAVIGGAFSRMGYGRRIAAAGALAAVVRIGGFALQALSVASPWLNLLQYALPVGAFGWAMWILLGREIAQRRRAPAGALAAGAA